MRRVRLLLVAGMITAMFGVGAAPAHACQPDGYCPPCGNEKIDGIYQKLTGKPLFHCPW